MHKPASKTFMDKNPKCGWKAGYAVAVGDEVLKA